MKKLVNTISVFLFIFGLNAQSYLFFTTEQLSESTYRLETDLTQLSSEVLKISTPIKEFIIQKSNIVYHNDSDFTMTGKLQNEPYFFFLSKSGNTFIGSIKENGISHSFVSNKESNFKFVYSSKKIEGMKCGNESITIEDSSTTGSINTNNQLDSNFKIGKSTTENTGCDNDGCQLRILVLYTPKLEARKGAGTITAQANISIAELNQSFVNGGVNHTAVLAGSEKMFSSSGFEKNGVFGTPISGVDAIKKLTNTSDGYVDYHINNTRPQLNADIVLVFHRWAMSGIAGRASSIGGHRDSIPCAVMQFEEVQNGIVFPHEVGHLLGLRHDNDNSSTPYSAGHGFVSNNDFASIMVGGTSSATRTLLWSSPNTFVGSSQQPLGNLSIANSANILNTSIPIATGFREILYDLNLDNVNGQVDLSYFRTHDINFKNSVIDQNSCLFFKAGNEITLTEELFINNYFHGIIEDPYCSDGIIENSQFDFKDLRQYNSSNAIEDLSFYPNPVKVEGKINFDIISDLYSRMVVSLFDLNGKMLTKYTPDQDGDIVLVDINSGLYFLNVEIDNKFFGNYKLVINE